jgi:hypothetical protein
MGLASMVGDVRLSAPHRSWSLSQRQI